MGVGGCGRGEGGRGPLRSGVDLLASVTMRAEEHRLPVSLWEEHALTLMTARKSKK